MTGLHATGRNISPILTDLFQLPFSCVFPGRSNNRPRKRRGRRRRRRRRQWGVNLDGGAGNFHLVKRHRRKAIVVGLTTWFEWPVSGLKSTWKFMTQVGFEILVKFWANQMPVVSFEIYGRCRPGSEFKLIESDVLEAEPVFDWLGTRLGSCGQSQLDSRRKQHSTPIGGWISNRWISQGRRMNENGSNDPING